MFRRRQLSLGLEVDPYDASVGSPFVYAYENMIRARGIDYVTPGLPDNTTAMRQLSLSEQQRAWWAVATNSSSPHLTLIAPRKFQLLQPTQQPLFPVPMASDNTKPEDLIRLLAPHIGAALPYRDETDSFTTSTMILANPAGKYIDIEFIFF